jgi:hypothetical protein
VTNTLILTDAEYGQLTEVERTDYWRRRFYALEDQYDELRVLCRERGELLSRLREVLDRA